MHSLILDRQLYPNHTLLTRGDYWKQVDFSTNFYIDAYQKIYSISVSSQPVYWPNNSCWSQIPVPTSNRQTTERCSVCAQHQVAAVTHSLPIRSPAVSHVFSQHLRSNFQGDAVWLIFFKDCWQWLWIMHAPEKPPIWSVHHHEQLININRDSAMVKTAAACFHRVALSSAAFYVTAALLKTLNELKTPNKRVVLCTCIT